MGIYLGSVPILGANQNGLIKEVYAGADRKYIRWYGGLLPGTFRIQFSDTSYDPATATWADTTTWGDHGWTLKRLAYEPNLWEFRHTANLENDPFAPFRNKSGIPNPPTAGYMVTEVLPSANWTNYTGLFAAHHYLTYASEFPAALSTTASAAYMFDDCPRLSNDIEWARHIAGTIPLMTSGETPSAGKYITGTPHASSIPVPFGGTKGRANVVHKTGAGPFDETFSVVFRPGDWCYIAARGYTGSNKSYGYINARTAGTEMVTSRKDSSTRFMTVTASGSTGSKVTGEFTVRWGYPLSTTMTCGSCRRVAYSSNNPYANVYSTSYQFY